MKSIISLIVVLVSSHSFASTFAYTCYETMKAKADEIAQTNETYRNLNKDKVAREKYGPIAATFSAATADIANVLYTDSSPVPSSWSLSVTLKIQHFDDGTCIVNETEVEETK